jgi:hypothetical protein
MDEIRIRTGSISSSYLKKVSRTQFDKDFAHISEEERNDAWTQTHESEPVPKKSPKPKHS